MSLEGAPALSRLPTQLRKSASARPRSMQPAALEPSQSKLSFACWDDYTGGVYAVMGEAVVRVVAQSGDTTVVAGHPTQQGQVCASYSAASRSLLLCTDTAVYGLPLADLWADTARAHRPALVAGSEDEEGNRDGAGAEARVNDIWGMAVDGTGTAWVLDRAGTQTTEATRLARVDPNGAVTTVPVRRPGA